MGRLAGSPARSGEVRLRRTAATFAGQLVRDRQQGGGALTVIQAVFQPVQPGEVLVRDSVGQATGQSVDR
jgi:hypothetical protein